MFPQDQDRVSVRIFFVLKRGEFAIINMAEMTCLEAKMLAALTNGNPDVSVAKISTDEQKQYLIRWVNTLPLEDRRAVGNVLAVNDLRSSLRPCAEGTIINLDALPAGIIEQMYDVVATRRATRQPNI